jgi:hypothetical protein
MVNTGANNSRNSTKIEVQGQEFLIPYLDRPWDSKDLTVKDIKRYEEDFFIQNVFMKLTNFIFLGPPTFNILQGDKSREDLADWIREMIKKVGLVNLMKVIWYDVCIWGNSLCSDGIEKDQKNRWIYSEHRSLPPELFEYPGGTSVSSYMYGNYAMNPNYTYGRLLKGIERRDDGTIHYWQRNNYEVVEIENCRHIKSPVRSYFLDGVPLFNPLYKLLPKVYFALDQLMMHNNRSNMFFLSVDDTGKQTLPDNKTSKWEYSKNVLKSANNKTWFPLPGGVEPKELSGPSSDIHIKTIDVLTKWIISFITPTDIISKGDGSLIGGSSNYEAQLFKIFSESLQDFIAAEIEKLLDNILIWNGWLDCHSEVKMKRLKFDNEELDLEVAKLVLDAQKSGFTLASINEWRNKLDWEDASIEFLQDSQKEWEAVKRKVETPEMPGSPEGYNKNGSEQLEEEEVKEDLKENQAKIPTREEIEEETLQELSKKISKTFSDIEKVFA